MDFHQVGYDYLEVWRTGLHGKFNTWSCEYPLLWERDCHYGLGGLSSCGEGAFSSSLVKGTGQEEGIRRLRTPLNAGRIFIRDEVSELWGHRVTSVETISLYSSSKAFEVKLVHHISHYFEIMREHEGQWAATPRLLEG